MEFERMPGFHKLISLWRIDYRAIAKEPILTMTADEETKELADRIVGKKIQKTYPDLVPLIFEGRAGFSGNAVKGLFRHLIAAQLTAAGIPVCVQDVKAPEGVPEGRRRQCKPPDLCFVCNWFGTASRQGALHFSFLLSTQPYEEVISKDPIPMIALSDENMGAAGRAFLMAIAVKPGTEFRGWIKGENLSKEIIGAIAEVVNMSKEGFVQFGGLKTRGFGAMELEITSIKEYSTTPFELKKEYVGGELDRFLGECREAYHRVLGSRG